MHRAARFDRLVALLAALPAAQQDVRLELAAIEQLLGHGLARAARTAAYWTSSPVARHHWGAQGFVGQLDAERQAVVFRRTTGGSAVGADQADRCGAV
jgi:hypothetical protein